MCDNSRLQWPEWDVELEQVIQGAIQLPIGSGLTQTELLQLTQEEWVPQVGTTAQVLNPCQRSQDSLLHLVFSLSEVV
jgi:hypothetical protein